MFLISLVAIDNIKFFHIYVYMYVCVYVDAYAYYILYLRPCHHTNNSKAKSERARVRWCPYGGQNSLLATLPTPQGEDLPISVWEGVVGSEPTKD